jgi:hypothetical protein
VKTITNNTRPIDTTTKMNMNDRLSSNPIGITEAFNNYFSSTAKKILNDNPSRYPSVNNKEFLAYLHQNFHHSFPKMKFNNMNVYEIQKIILPMKPKNSHGYDEI